MAEKNEQLLPAFALAKKRMELGGAKFSGLQNLKDGMSKNGHQDFDNLTWPKGVECVIPAQEVLEERLFVSQQNERTRPAYGVVLDCKDGRSRTLYFSTLTRTVTPYKAANGGFEVDYSRPILESNTDFHGECMNCPTDLDIFNLLVAKSGKTLAVTECPETETARMRFTWDNEAERFNAEAIGLRRGRVPFFTCN